MKIQKLMMVIWILLLSGCAYQRYGIASGGGNQPQSVDPIVADCQRQLGPAPSTADQAATTFLGAAFGAAGNAAFNAVIGGDPGRGAALGGLGGGAIGGVAAAMQPVQYQEALRDCIWQTQQQQAEAYANLPCEIHQKGSREGNNPWKKQEEYECLKKTSSPPP